MESVLLILRFGHCECLPIHFKSGVLYPICDPTHYTVEVDPSITSDELVNRVEAKKDISKLTCWEEKSDNKLSKKEEKR